MWIFLPDSFLSVVDKGDSTGATLLVRARRAGDIERVFPDAKLQTGDGTDYAFRARIDREHVALVMADAVRGIGYGNFKDQITDRVRHDAYMDCWSAVYQYQDRR